MSLPFFVGVLIMIRIKTNDEIRLTRGDSAYITINLVDADGNPYLLDKDTERLRCQVRRILNDDGNSGLLFEGEITDNGDGTATWHIRPQDTSGAYMPDKYYYDIQMEVGEDVFTIVSGKFRLLDEVTLKKEG